MLRIAIKPRVSQIIGNLIKEYYPFVPSHTHFFVSLYSTSTILPSSTFCMQSITLDKRNILFKNQNKIKTKIKDRG